VHRFSAEWDRRYPVEIGIIGEVGASTNTLTEALLGHRFAGAAPVPASSACKPTNSPVAHYRQRTNKN